MKTCNKCKSYKCTCQQKIVVSAEPQKIIERVIVESKPCPGPKGEKGDKGDRGPAGIGSVDYVSNVEYNVETTSLDFTGVGNAFNGSVLLPEPSTNNPLQMKIGLSQTETSNPTITEFFNNTGETLEFIRFSVGYYYTILPESMYDLFIEHMYMNNPFATSNSYVFRIAADTISMFFELDGTDRLISILCQDQDLNLKELSAIISSGGVLFLPTIYVKNS